ncbi:MAG: CAP domain-containing protein [Dehalococcoidia bacterium]
MIRRLLSGALAAIVFGAMGLAAFSASPPTAAALTNCTVNSGIELDSEEVAFLVLINNYRAQNQLGALTASTNLNRASAWMSNDMGVNARFSHTDSLGRSPSTRAQNCDYPSGAGENIAAGTNWNTAAAVFEAWRNSSGHNANMLNSSYRMIGIGRVFVSGSPYGWYWTTAFGLVNDGTNGGGGGGTPPPPPPPADTKAAITSPASGATLPGASVTFQWSAGTGAQQYFLYVGTSAGSNNLYGAGTTSRSATVGNLPTDGRQLYVRLWTLFSSGWQFNDYTYTAFTSGGGGGGSTETKSVLTSPVAGAVISGGSQTFRWTSVPAGYYRISVGDTQGSRTYGRSTTSRTSRTYTNLPTDGRTIWVRIETRINGFWQANDYSFPTGP